MLVVFGVVPVVVAFFVALSFLGKQEVETQPAPVDQVVEEEPPPPETRTVLSAARELPVGTLVGDGDLDELVLEVSAFEAGYIVVSNDSNARTYRGYAVRQALPPGTPITRSALVGPGQKGFLAAVLRPGTRAVTVRVGAATSQAGLIDPGDRVDVILSAELKVDQQELEVYARTIVEDARIVAVDHRVNGEEYEQTEAITATLEVSPPDGDRLVLAEHEGRLSLAVRSLAAVASPPPREAVALRELLLSPAEVALSEERRRRERELSELSILTQIAESKEQLRAAVSEEELQRERELSGLSILTQIAESNEQLGAVVKRSSTTFDTVRIHRGGVPAEEVVFERVAPILD